MANVLVDETSLQNIANTIREKGGTGSYYPSKMASAINNICNNNVAFADNGSFWSALQGNGTRINYNSIFKFFTDFNFKPRYNMSPTDAGSMFEESKITDLTVLLNNAGKTLDFSQVTTMYRMFYKSTITHCPRIILSPSSTVQLNCTFIYCKDLVTIDGLFTNVNTVFNRTFDGCTSLKNIKIEEGAEIGNNVSFANSPLSRESIISIINALSINVTGKTLTLKTTAKTSAFTDSEWATLIATKPNWTISLV